MPTDEKTGVDEEKEQLEKEFQDWWQALDQDEEWIADHF